jgi:hypothetical protein
MTTMAGAKAKQQTAVTVAWDDESLTVTFDCTDAAVAAAWAKERDSGKTWKDDSVAVLLDVGHGHVPSKNFLSFKLSAAGGLQDSRGINRDPKFTVADCTSSAARTDTGWRGTIRIPWKGLGAAPKEGEIWGVNFTRIDHEETYAGLEKAQFMAWAPFDQDFESLPHFGHLVFASPEAATDKAAVAALRETVRLDHAAIADKSFFPHKGHVLTATAAKPGVATGFTLVPSGAAPRLETSVAATWFGRGLNLFFDCVDSAVLGVQKGRDNIKLWKDDSVYVWLDPGHAHSATRDLIMVQVSASGEVHDLQNGDIKFDVAEMVATCSRTGTGWRAHLFLPWKGLGASAPKPGEVWGVNFMRMDQPGKLDFQNMQSSSWIPVLDGDAMALDRWGHLVFADGEADAAAGQEAMEKSHAARRAAILEKNK